MDKEREKLIEILAQGGKVFSDSSGFVVNAEEDDSTVYPMYNIYHSIFANPKYTPLEKALYHYLKGLENTQIKGAFPSHEKIIECMGITKMTLIKALKSMEEKNMIFILKRRWYDTKKQTSNLYFFNSYNKQTGEFYTNGLESLYKEYPNKKALAYIYTDKSSNDKQLILLAE